MSPATLTDFTKEPVPGLPDAPPLRSAWVEVDLGRLRRNYQIINQDKPAGVQILSVLKDDGYGHGALGVGKNGARRTGERGVVSGAEHAG